MTDTSNQQIHKPIYLIMLISLFTLSPVIAQAQEGRPVADAGLSRYAGPDPIVLDGTGSYDPNESGPLSYLWQQISGPSVVISDANTATPTVSGFIQTEEIQECEFELIVSNGEYDSLPDTVRVVVIPDFGESNLKLENKSFDPNKPTVIYFRGRGCVTGGGSWGRTAWSEKANIISFPNYYPDPDVLGLPTYYRCGDMIIVYLSSVAPDYKQPIQTIGFSGGGDPAMDVGIRLNRVYRDARYAVNRVSELDTWCRPLATHGGSWELYNQIVESFLSSSVAGEQCWIDFYFDRHELFPFHDVLAVSMGLTHQGVQSWYQNSLTYNDMNNFNSGLVAGAYWSVIGPGKNLQLAPQTDAYYFRWDGNEQSGSMSLFLQSQHPGRLPEPVTLIGPENGSFVDANGALFSCEESENAVGYQLLFGPDPYCVMDYYIISDTPSPPTEVVTASAFEQTWWTIKVRDQYGSTIYADPIRINFENLAPPPIENLTIGKGYASIRRALDDAWHGHEIVVSPGIYKGDINFQSKNLTLRSANPNDSSIVATTIIEGYGRKSVVTLSGGEDANCVLTGFTIKGGSMGIQCGAASPTISNCSISQNGTVSIELWLGSNPIITNCTILGDVIVQPVAENLTIDKRYIYIQRAIDEAANSDEIVVSKGTFCESINFNGKNLMLRSTNPNDSAVVAATVIDGNNQDSVVTFTSGEDANSVFAGFTITGGNAENGGGIYCGENSTPTITNCNIINNSATQGGGGMYTDNSSPKVINCIFSGNSAQLGGGVFCNTGSPTIINCTFSQNTAFWSGGIFNLGNPVLTNSIVWGNTDPEIEGIVTATYSNIRGGWPGEGNIDADPLFADPDNGDYHLKSPAGRWDPNSEIWIQDDVTSPCIDAGDPTNSVDLEPALNGGRINMGAYGGTSEASKSP